jgi:peptide/nickel transport system permease protein
VKNMAEKKLLTQREKIIYAFFRNKLGIVGMATLIILYILVIFAGFISPYNMTSMHNKYSYLAPVRIHFFDKDGHFHILPFVYGLKQVRNPVTFAMEYKIDKSKIYAIHFFVRGEEWSFFGIFKSDIHLFGIDEDAHAMLALFGTDKYGRDLFSRVLYGGQVSMSVGLVGVTISLVLGAIIGSLSGYYGGTTDLIVQRIIELLMSFPTLPLWLALSMIIPPSWPSTWVYFGVVTVLSLLGWMGIARVVRGMVLSLREKEFVLAAKLAGQSDFKIILRHVIPNVMGYLIVIATLSIPGMILGESALSFLGLGIKEPMASWGLLLSEAQSMSSIALHPWLMVPGIFIVVAVLAFTFLGDSLRDALDPYKVSKTL